MSTRMTSRGSTGVTDVYRQVVDAINELADVHGVDVESMRFSRSDVPIDWDEETNRWVALDG